MRKGTKVWLWIAISVALIACIMFVVVMSMVGWDFSKLATGNYVTNEYVLTEDFQNIHIDSNVADVALLPTNDGTTKVVCREKEKGYHNVTIQDDTLVILEVGTGKWTDHITIYPDGAKITLYLPQEKYDEVIVRTKTGNVNNYVTADQIKISAGTGDIFVENISAGTLELSVSTGTVTVMGVTCEKDIKVDTETGRMNIMNVRCENFSSEGSTGDVVLEKLIADKEIFVLRSTGNVKFDNCDAYERIMVEVNTGDVKGSFLSGKMFTVNTDTGIIQVPPSEPGCPVCQISTRTGDVRITVNDYLMP